MPGGSAVTLLVAALALAGQTRPARPAPKPAEPKAPVFFTAALTPEEMKGKQAVLDTTAGTIVLDLLSEAAPNHVGYFMKLAAEGAYDGTTFHRLIKMGIVQAGDPISKDPSQRAKYGTGGLGVLRAEPNPERHTRGAVSAVLVPGQRDSAGAQFFICITDQPALDGQYTVFARVVEGINVAQKISEAPVDAEGRAVDRIEIRKVALRDKPPPPPVPFTSETAEQLAQYRAVLETSLGEITLDLMPDKAPEHVRNFLRLASVGVYDGTAFHRVAPRFVIQTGFLTTRREPLDERQQALVPAGLAPEFNDTLHVKGVVSMAHGDDPASASTSFFIVVGTSTGLDRQYTAFARVVGGMDVVEKIEAVPVQGETPVERVELTRVRVEKKQ
jgi:peptidyl-prolyl cis-trans isomerase B (cyclophilin B)